MSASSGIESVRASIADAAAKCGRAPEDITLVAVTKGFAWRTVQHIVEGARLTDLGENRVQELRAKQDEAAGSDVRWHLIGPLQSNKVTSVVGRVALIHSVDSRALAEAIGRRALAAGLIQDVLLQVNASGESTKNGVAPSEAEQAARSVADVDGVALRGFMTLAAPGDAQAARACFGTLRGIRDVARRSLREAVELSMGMSGDFTVAIAEGATIVRVGTAIFGSRDAPELSDR